MPAIMTHDFFGRDALHAISGGEALSKAEQDAFLLGNQGPDPLFYLRANPFLGKRCVLGNRMHAEKTNELIYLLKRSLYALDPRDVPIGRAYAQGFLCHFLLDSNMHPLVYSRQFAVCDAGVEGLSRRDGSAVHAVIESEFDEMVLYEKYGVTIADYSPATHILHGDDEVLRIVGLVYSFLLSHVYGAKADADLFKTAVYDFRFVQQLLYSPHGAKRQALGKTEQLLMRHRYSVIRGMSHRPIELADTWFANSSCETWKNPWTGDVDTRSFWDIYRDALERAVSDIAVFEKLDFSEEDAAAISHGVNFSGKPLPGR